MTKSPEVSNDPHRGQPIRMAGESISSAHAAMLMMHGRGASAEDILSLADLLKLPGVVYLAPQAAENVWYPNRFLEPLSSNEPWLSSALSTMENVLSQILQAGIPREHILLLGFSQGACMALEFAARHAARYAGVVGLSGVLIGPEDAPRDYPGSLSGTPVFLGCSDVDPYMPKERIDHAAEVMRRLGGNVTERLYPGLGHTTNQDEIEFIQRMMQTFVTPS
jgi:phospholipase/carboxylesterase